LARSSRRSESRKGVEEGVVLVGNWGEVTTATGFPEGAAIKTDRTIYLGFGLEGVTGAADRATLMGRAMGYLLR
jgi:hypothetical protein